jgi:gliding motility-associated-like protein
VVPTDNAPPYTFLWTNANGDTLKSGNGSAGDTVSNLAAGTYILNFTNSQGCSQQHIYTVTQPVYGAVFSASPAIICDGTQVTFTDLSFGNVTSYAWTFGDGSSSNQQNPKHTYASTGTYTVTLTITVQPNCVASASQTLEVHPNITGGFSVEPPPYCVGNEIQFTDETVGNPAQWNWSFGDGGSSSEQNPAYAYGSAGTYNVFFTATDSFCGATNGSATLTVYSIPEPALRPDTILCEGAVIALAANDSGDAYLWSNGDTTAVINYVMPSDSVDYVWVSVDNNGCKGYDTLILRNRCIVVLPDAFSPNDDGKNDVFHPLAANVIDFDFLVFNRWGQEVYADNSGDVSKGWDGKINGEPQPVGVYVYFITGHFESLKAFTRQGNVTLVR